jgi:hypothetical protein
MQRSLVTFLVILFLGFQPVACAHRPLSGSVSGITFKELPADQEAISALQAIMAFSGKNVPEKDIGRALQAIGAGGDNPTGLLSYPLGVGLMTVEVGPDLDDVEDAITRGHPILATLRLDPAALPRRNYVIITSFDRKAERFAMTSPGQSEITMSYQDFLKAWTSTGRFAFYVEPERHP